MAGTIPIIHLRGGEEITPRLPITDARTRHWKYAAECDPINGTLATGTRLVVVDYSKLPGHMWVKVQIPGRTPPGFLKIAGPEYASAFQGL